MVCLFLILIASLAANTAFAEGAGDSKNINPQTIPQNQGLAKKLKPCRVAGIDEEVLCGRYDVYENRAAKSGRKIGLNIVVLPAKGPDVASDPLVFLAGGGVAPATGYAAFLWNAFPNLRRQRDVLLIDQRGTGGSNPLDCDLSTDPANAVYRDDSRFLDSVRECRKKLEEKADLRYYTTPIAMDDLDEVREWLGYSRLNLFGASYGTTASMVYVRQHRERVRTVTMQGVVPLDEPMWLEYPRTAQEALDRVFATCAKQAGCHQAFPELEKEFNSLLNRLSEKPVNVKVSPSEKEPEVEVTINDEVMRLFVSRVMYSASRIHNLPLLIHLAYQGDYELIARMLASKDPNVIPKGIYLSIVCNENLRFDHNAVQTETAGTFMRGFRVGREISACQQWPHGWLPQNFWMPVKSDVPALVLNGSIDHVTPPRYADRVAKTLSNSRRVDLPNHGHNDIDPCVCGIIESFIIAGNSDGLDTSCLAKSEELSFALNREQLQD